MMVVRYNEPGEDEPVRLSVAEAVEWRKQGAAQRGYQYALDYDALDDFLIIHWGWLEEEK